MGAPDSSTPTPAPAAARELTGEERALYDRQIRLWGAEAQRKLSTARVLVIGDVRCCLLQEMAKNIVLAGIAGITFACEGITTPDADAAMRVPGFMGSEPETVRNALRAMNPLVDVKTVPVCKAMELVSDMDVVCSVGGNLEDDCKLSEVCASKDTPFFAGRGAGFIGWVFLGLGPKYSYTSGGSASGGTPAQETIMQFPTLRNALEAPWGKEVKRSRFAWHTVATLLKFQQQHGRMPGVETEDAAKLQAIYSELVKVKSPAREAPTELLSNLAACAHVELPALSAVVGGVWGREVVKVLSRKDAPLKNLFMFNLKTSEGVVETSL